MCKNWTTVKDTLVHLIPNGRIKVFQNLNALIKRKERLFLPKKIPKGDISKSECVSVSLISKVFDNCIRDLMFNFCLH